VELLARNGTRRGRIGVDRQVGPLGRVPRCCRSQARPDARRHARAALGPKTKEKSRSIAPAASLSDWARHATAKHPPPGCAGARTALWRRSSSRRRRSASPARMPTALLDAERPSLGSPHGEGAPTGARFEKGHVVVTICNIASTAW